MSETTTRHHFPELLTEMAEVPWKSAQNELPSSPQQGRLANLFSGSGENAF